MLGFERGQEFGRIRDKLRSWDGELPRQSVYDFLPGTLLVQ